MRKLLTGQRRISLSFLALALAVAFVFALQGCQIQENSKTREALCALRQDVERRIEATDDLLAKNPRGDIFGIPRALIISGRKNQQLTVEALSNLDC